MARKILQFTSQFIKTTQKAIATSSYKISILDLQRETTEFLY